MRPENMYANGIACHTTLSCNAGKKAAEKSHCTNPECSRLVQWMMYVQNISQQAKVSML